VYYITRSNRFHQTIVFTIRRRAVVPLGSRAPDDIFERDLAPLANAL
jgi:hypothetical protein